MESGVESISKTKTSWEGIEFGEFNSRLSPEKYLGLTSFWFSVLVFLYLSYYYTSSIITVLMLLAIWLMAGINILLASIRRFHDLGRTGLWTVVWLILLACSFTGHIQLLWLVFTYTLACFPGSKGDNQYGAPPTAPSYHYYLMLTAYLISLGIGYYLISH